jgi:hypothetical protein
MAKATMHPLSGAQQNLINTKYWIANTGLVLRSKCEQDGFVAPERDQVEYCKLWIKECCRRQRVFNRDAGSYSLKVCVENKAREEKREDTYISNGAFIQAAVELGYKVKAHKDSPNAIFNMKIILPEHRWKHVRPTGFSKWLFQQKDVESAVGMLAIDALADSTWPRKAIRFVDFYLYLDETRSADKSYLDGLIESWRQRYNEDPSYVTQVIRDKCDKFYGDDCDLISYKDPYPIAPDGKTNIYVLFEVETVTYGDVKCEKSKVRYVGQSVNPAKRLRQHVLCPGSEKRVIWVAEQLKKGEYPRMAIVDVVDKGDATNAETMFIVAFGNWDRGEEQKITDVLMNEYLTS